MHTSLGYFKNQMIYVKSIAGCLAHGKDSINAGQHFLLHLSVESTHKRWNLEDYRSNLVLGWTLRLVQCRLLKCFPAVVFSQSQC